MTLTEYPTFPALVDLLHNAVSEGITRLDENRVRVVVMSWLSEHGIEAWEIYEDRHPVSFVYGTGDHAVQIEVFVKHNGHPLTVIVGTPPADTVMRTRPANVLVDDAWPVQ